MPQNLSSTIVTESSNLKLVVPDVFRGNMCDMIEMDPSVAVIGCGYWGKNIVRNFSEIGALRMISDPSPQNARVMSEKFGIPCVGLDEILADDGVKGVAIAAPAPLHFDLASKCLNAGKHVMVEKPVALTSEDAVKLIDLSKNVEKLLMVGHLLNYHNGFLKICELVQSGAIGNLRRIYSNRLSFGKVRTEENVLWSFAPHDISMILRLLNGKMPKSVNAFGGDYVSRGIADFAHVHMTCDDGVTAHVFVSWLHPFKEQRLVVIGENGMLVFDDTAAVENKVSLYRHTCVIENGIPVLNKADCEFVEIEPSEPLKSECQYFIAGMEDPASIYTNGEEGLRVLDVLTKAQQSMEINSGQA